MEIIISNTIRIKDPEVWVQNWCKENLVLPNPEYAKKQRLGFWLGRTPKTISLFEIQGDTWVLPYGVLTQLPQLREGAEYDFKDAVTVEYGSNVPLYDYQLDAVYAMTTAQYGILQSAAGSGKTQMGIALIETWGKRALWLCHTADLLKQSRDRALQYMDKSLIGTITEGKVQLGTGVTFATVQTMCHLNLSQYKDYWDVVVVDECFPGDTMIATEAGEMPICQILAGDKVWTRDSNGKLALNVVTGVFKKTPNSLMTFRLKNGTTLTCTSNHPILTKKGYVRADEITFDDEVCCVRKDIRHINSEQDFVSSHISRKAETSLLQRMLYRIKGKKFGMDARAQRDFPAEHDRGKQEVRFSPNESTQPNEPTRDTREDDRNTSGNRPQTKGTRRQWTWYDGSPSRIDELPYFLSTLRRIHNTNTCKTNGVSNALQDRHCVADSEDRNRSGRWFSLFQKGARGRQAKDRVFEWVGLDSIEIHKPASDGTFVRMSGENKFCNTVYNLEVETNHNYFANGVNVHNCHRVSGSPTSMTMYYKVLSNLAARHKYGLSATPDRSDGLIKGTFALLGDVRYTVPDEAVESTIMKVTVHPIFTGTTATDECYNPDGTLNYSGMISSLCKDKVRTELIVRCITACRDHSNIVLSDRLDHLESMLTMLPEELFNQAIMIHGKTPKRIRDSALELMRTGEKRFLFATYALAKEGLDVPRLDTLFLTTPVKYHATVIQSLGRIARRFEGKENPVAFDFVDNIRYCIGAYKERCKHYRKAGVTVEG